MKQVLILIFIFVLSHISFGQQKTIKFNSYGIENGLSQSHVTSIVQDDNGFVWIATQDGLNRFNGYEFEVFKQHLKDTNSIPNNYIHCLLNYKDKLWFGTNRGIGAIDINNLEIQKINRSNYKELKGYIFTKLGFDANDNLWALSEKHGINVINIETKDIEIISTINGYSDFSTLFFDSQKNIWVGTKSGKILKSNPPYKSFIEIQNEELIINSNINTFYQTLDSNILMCTSYGLYKIDQKNKVQYVCICQNKIKQIVSYTITSKTHITLQVL